MMMNHLTSIYMIHNFMSGGVALIPGLCCLKFLFACNTQLRRVVMCFEINISCLTVSSIHPALQMLQLPITIEVRASRSSPPLSLPPHCVSSVYLLVRSSRPSPSVSRFCILHSLIKDVWEHVHFTRVIAADNKKPLLKEFKHKQ